MKRTIGMHMRLVLALVLAGMAPATGSHTAATCSNTNGYARDAGGDSCSWYIGGEGLCGNFDDSDFRANSMCCACRFRSYRVYPRPTPPPPPPPTYSGGGRSSSGGSPPPPSSSREQPGEISYVGLTGITAATIMGIIVALVLVYSLLHVAAWKFCGKRDFAGKPYSPQCLDIFCPSFMVAGQDGCSPGCLLAACLGNCFCGGPSWLPCGALYTACCWKPQTPWTHREFPKPVTIAVTCLFGLVFLLAAVGTGEPTMIVMKDGTDEFSQYQEHGAWNYRVGGSSRIGGVRFAKKGDECEYWEDIEPGTKWRTSIADACKAAKAFSILGLLGNVVVIPAVLANFKILPDKFHVHGRMASMVSILTTGFCYFTVAMLWLGIYMQVVAQTTLLHFRDGTDYWSLGSAFALYCTSLVLLIIGFWIVWVSKDPSGANDAAVAAANPFPDAAPANPFPDTAISAQPQPSVPNPAFSSQHPTFSSQPPRCDANPVLDTAVSAAQPGYPPAAQPGYPPAAQPGYPLAAQPGYPPVAQPGYPPAAQPGYPPAQPQPSVPNFAFSSQPPCYDANDTNPFPDAEPEPLPPIATELGLSLVDFAAYKHLWEAVQSDDRLPAGAALKFFGKSGIDEKKAGTLRTMWGLVDTELPKGSLNQDEFIRACKLVAQVQAGQTMSVATLAVATPLPIFDGIDQLYLNSEC